MNRAYWEKRRDNALKKRVAKIEIVSKISLKLRQYPSFANESKSIPVKSWTDLVKDSYTN